MVLLLSLPTSYSSLVTSLGINTDKLKLEEVHSAILELRLQGQVSVVGNDAALVGATGRTDNSKSTYRCYSCNNFGHIARDCPKSSGSHTSHTSQRSNSRACGSCFRGHRPNQNRNTQHRAKVASQPEREFVFMAGKQTAKDHDWIIDSGASSHMTWKPELLSDYKELPKPQSVKLGDGRTVNAISTGAIKIMALNDKT